MVGLVEVTQIALNKADLKLQSNSEPQECGSTSADGADSSKEAAGKVHPPTPKWITPMLLFIDLYEKVRFFFYFSKTLIYIFLVIFFSKIYHNDKNINIVK